MKRNLIIGVAIALSLISFYVIYRRNKRRTMARQILINLGADSEDKDVSDFLDKYNPTSTQLEMLLMTAQISGKDARAYLDNARNK